jgi:hypothetical protein
VVETGNACRIFLVKEGLVLSGRMILIGILNKWFSGCEEVVYGSL